MTLILLTLLAVAWLGYFAICLRARLESRSERIDGMIDASQFSHYLELPVGYEGGVREVSSPASLKVVQPRLDDLESKGTTEVSRGVTYLLEAPRTPQQALRRRRNITAWFTAVALLSLMLVPSLGTAALVMHLTVDVVLVLFLFGVAQRQQLPAENLAEVRALYPDHPAFGAAVDTPMRHVVNG